jgi:hypothetical protein
LTSQRVLIKPIKIISRKLQSELGDEMETHSKPSNRLKKSEEEEIAETRGFYFITI